MREDDLITRLREAPGPEADVDPETVTSRARARRSRRTALLSSLAALVVVGAGLGVGTQLLPRGASTSGGAAVQAESVPVQPEAEDQDAAGAVAQDANGVALRCPATLRRDAQWASSYAAPSLQPQVDTGGRIVPTAQPSRAVICRYEPQPRMMRLTASAVVAGDLADLRDRLLASQPADLSGARACAPRPAGTADDYLLGLEYGQGGAVWLVIGGCVVATNGVETVEVGEDTLLRMQTALSSGRWESR